MCCPTPSFVEPAFIHSMKKCLNTDGRLVFNKIYLKNNLFHSFSSGFVMMNLLCPKEVMRNEVLEILRESFTSVHVEKIEGQINEVVLCCLNHVK